jgi:hypothetical protein
VLPGRFKVPPAWLSAQLVVVVVVLVARGINGTGDGNGSRAPGRILWLLQQECEYSSCCCSAV